MDISWLAWECLDVPPEDWEEVAQENMISAVILKLLSTQTQTQTSENEWMKG